MTQPTTNPSSDQLRTIKNLSETIKSGNDPVSVLNMAAQQNPQIAAVMNMVSGSKMTPKQMFTMMAQQRGIDPNQIVNMLKN
jgi:hypothetical protein